MSLFVFLAIISAFIGVLLIEGSGMRDDVTKLIGGLCLVGCGIFISLVFINVNKDTTYYLPSEIVAENETSVYFGTEEGHIYYIAKYGVEYPDTVQYLLCMDSNGTSDITDDVIIGIWRSVE